MSVDSEFLDLYRSRLEELESALEDYLGEYSVVKIRCQELEDLVSSTRERISGIESSIFSLEASGGGI